MGSYLALSAVLLAACAARRRDLTVLQPVYWSFLLRPWKLASFAVLGLGITLPAPYLDYHSWDVPIAAGQAVLSFLLAPWSVGVLARALRARRAGFPEATALWALLVTSCWWVEVYLLLRDGSYMPDWLANCLVSPACFVAVGLLWNVERRGPGYYHFAFLREAWPAPLGQEVPGGASG
ncbi:MAG: hypothetical protein AB7N76_12900 [Planctomycetota bacterium]